MNHRTSARLVSRRLLVACLVLVLPGSTAIPRAAVCATVAHPPAPAAQDPEPPRWLLSMFSWLAAVNTHKAGQADAAIGASVTPRLVDLEDTLSDVLALGATLASRARARETGAGNAATLRDSQKPIEYRGRSFTSAELRKFLGLRDEEPVRAGLNRLLRRAAVYHADVALVSSRQDAIGLPRPGWSSIIVGDGHERQTTTSTVHWAFGRELVDHLDAGPSRDEFAPAWYLATSAALQSLNMVSEAEDHLSRARQVLPNDARLLFYGACALETETSPTIQAALGPETLLRRSPGSSRIIVTRPSVRSLLDRAEQLFRRTLERDQTLTEARVRLARLVARRGQHAEAIDHLRKALADEPAKDVRYLALMLLGDEEQAVGRRAEARGRYEAAALLYPTAQSPLLALGLLAREGGDRAAAVAALDRLAALPADPEARVDPFWGYYVMQGRDAEALLHRLYALSAKEGS